MSGQQRGHPPTAPTERNPAPDADPGATARRRRLVVLAGHTGELHTVRAHLSDPAPQVRAAALGALERAGDLHHHDLSAGLADPAPSVRRRAAELAARRGGLDTALLITLDDHDATVAEAAAFALGEHLAEESVRADVVEALSRVARGHEDALCRETAVAALGSLGDPRGLPAVLAACEDRATVRRRAVLALAAFDGETVTATLVGLCGDRDLQVRQAAEDLLAIEQGENL